MKNFLRIVILGLFHLKIVHSTAAVFDKIKKKTKTWYS